MINIISALFCGAHERIENPIEKLDFLNDFTKFSKITLAEIYSYKLRESKFGSYAIYKIVVKTNEIEYKIEKRFHEFLNLYINIQEKSENFNFSNFPKKKVFGNLEDSCLFERKKTLNNFLEKIIIIDDINIMILIFDFLEIFENYKSYKINFELCHYGQKIKNFAKNDDDEECLKLLLDLNMQKEESISNINKIHSFFFENSSPKINQQTIQILFNGYGEINGLISLCSKTCKDSHLVCIAGLKLICSLLSFEENLEADNYVQVFSQLSSRELGELNLGYHIVEKPSNICTKCSLKLLDLYRTYNPNCNSFFIIQLLDNEEAFLNFEKWKISSTIFSQKTESYKVDLENSRELSDDSKKQTKKMIKLNSFLSENKPKSALFRKQINHNSSPLLMKKTVSDT